MSFVDSWQDVALKKDGYIAKPIYSAILEVLVQNKRCIIHFDLYRYHSLISDLDVIQ